MALSLVTAPTVEPISILEAKRHCRVPLDQTDDDEDFESFIQTARAFVELFTHRSLTSQTWDLKLDEFPCGPIWLPNPPISSVTSVTYTDTNGTTQTWPASNYIEDLPIGPMARQGRILPAYQVIWPVVRPVPNAITVRYVAGYGSTATSVPSGLRTAIKHIVADLYRDREKTRDVQASTIDTVEALLWQFKTV